MHILSNQYIINGSSAILTRLYYILWKMSAEIDLALTIALKNVLTHLPSSSRNWASLHSSVVLQATCSEGGSTTNAKKHISKTSDCASSWGTSTRVLTLSRKKRMCTIGCHIMSWSVSWERTYWRKGLMRECSPLSPTPRKKTKKWTNLPRSELSRTSLFPQLKWRHPPSWTSSKRRRR